MRRLFTFIGMISCMAGLLLACFPTAFGQSTPLSEPRVLIHEVSWAGSDLSVFDEWVEIAAVGSGTAAIGNWTLTGMNSSGNEVILARFATGSLLSSGSYLVISRFDASSSRLLEEPFLQSASISLPNSKLLLRLRDSAGTVIDEVDDGIGVPFAGSNASAPAWKASMERIDPLAPGTNAENWRTATVSVGFDPDAPIFGSPGYPNGYSPSPSSSIPADPTDIQAIVDPEASALLLMWTPSVTASAQSYSLAWSNPLSGTGILLLPAASTGATLMPIRTDEPTQIFLHTFGQNGEESIGIEITIEPFKETQSSSSSFVQSSELSSENSSTFSSEISSSSTSASSISSVSSELLASSVSSSLSISSVSASSSCPLFTPTLSIQSGSPTGVGSTSINVEVVVPSGQKAPVRCLTEFGDGDTRESCNPPNHSYGEPGSYVLKITAWSLCGDVQTVSLPIEVSAPVAPSSSKATTGGSTTVSSSSLSSSLPSANNQTGFILHAVVPNPAGLDSESERFELFNSASVPLSLQGWTVTTGTTQKFLGVSTVAPKGIVTLKSANIGITLRNDSGSLSLQNPSGKTVSSVHWPKAADDDAYRPVDTLLWQATVLSVEKEGIFVTMNQSPFQGRFFVQILSTKSEILETSNLSIDLIKGKKLELQFNTHFKNSKGLLAHVFDEHGKEIVGETALLNTNVVQSGSGSEAAHDLTGISISELFPRPAVGEDEWIELRNDTDEDVLLVGAGLMDAGKTKPKLLGDRILPARGFLVITAKEAGVTLNDTGDTIRLVDSQGNEWYVATYGSLVRGSSYALVAGEWCPTSVATRGTENTCVLTAGKSASAGKATAAKSVTIKPTIRTVVSSSARSTGSGAAIMLASLITGENTAARPQNSGGGANIGLLSFLAILAGLVGGACGTLLRDYVLTFLPARSEN